MKSISSAMSSSLTLRRISSAEWHKKSPGKTSYTGMCQLETSIDQGYMPTRDIYRPDAHHPKKEDTISRNRDNFAMPRTVGWTWYPTFTHDSVVGDPRGSIITRKWEAWRILRKRGMAAIRSQETDEGRGTNIESKGETLANYYKKFLYSNPWDILY